MYEHNNDSQTSNQTAPDTSVNRLIALKNAQNAAIDETGRLMTAYQQMPYGSRERRETFNGFLRKLEQSVRIHETIRDEELRDMPLAHRNRLERGA